MKEKFRKRSICSITTVDITMDPFVLTQMNYMKERGWDTTVICNMSDDFIRRLPFGISHYDVKMKRSFNIWVAIKSTLQLYKIFKKNRYCIVQYAATHAALYSSIASWAARVPIRVHLQWGIYNYDEMGFAGYIYKFVEKLTCFFSTDIRPVSHKNLAIAIGYNLFKSPKGKVLGAGGTVGIDLNEYPLEEKGCICDSIRGKNGIPQDSFVYGFVGRISAAKGNNELLAAFKILHAQHSDVVLLLVGEDEGTVDRELINWALKCNKVFFTGRVAHALIPRYMAAMDVLVHPTYREGFGMVLQEAMAMEVPIITTNIPGPSEVIEPNKSGIVVPRYNANVLYEAMDDFHNGKYDLKEMGRAGRKRVETYFSRPIMLEHIFSDKEELYSDYLKRNESKGSIV